MPETSLIVVERPDLSLADVQTLHAQGEAVLASPHVGNGMPYRQAAMAAGVPAVFYDRKPTRDNGSHPGLYIVDGTATPLADEADRDRMVTHVAVSNVPDGAPTAVHKGEPLIDVHMRGYAEAYPGVSIATMSGFLLEHAGVVQDMTVVLAAAGFGEWGRYVDAEGNFHTLEGNPVELLQRYGLFKGGDERNDTQGLLLPHTYNNFMFAALGALDHGTASVYHVAGSTMVPSTLAAQDELAAMYSAVKESAAGSKLPPNLTYNLVPGAAARLAAPAAEQAALDTMLDAQAMVANVLGGLNDMRKTLASTMGAGVDRNKSLEGLKTTGNYVENYLHAAVLACSGLFVDSRDARYATQYDAAKARASGGETGFYVPTVTLNTALGELAAQYAKLEAYTKKALKTARS